jgi:hypothetical protein
LLVFKTDGRDIRKVIGGNGGFSTAENGRTPPEFIERQPLVLAKQLWGSSDVFLAHPVGYDKPGSVDFSKITKGNKGTLLLQVRNWPGCDCEIGLVKGGKLTEKQVLDKNKWVLLTVPFDREALLLEVKAYKEYNMDFAFISYTIK